MKDRRYEVKKIEEEEEEEKGADRRKEDGDWRRVRARSRVIWRRQVIDSPSSDNA